MLHMSDEELARRVEVGQELNEFCHYHQIKIPKVKIEFLFIKPQGNLRLEDHETWVWKGGIELL